jgi:hypothetical protein
VVISDLRIRLYIGSIEIIIRKPHQEEMDSSRNCTWDDGIDSTSFQEVDGIHDGIIFTPDSESRHLQLLFEGGLDDMATLSCESSSNIGHMVWDCTGGRFIWDPSSALGFQIEAIEDFSEVYMVRSV